MVVRDNSDLPSITIRNESGYVHNDALSKLRIFYLRIELEA